MAKVTFKKLIQTDPNDERGWIQLSAGGFVPAIPIEGTLIFIRKLNTNFIVHCIMMTSEETEEDGEITLVEIVPITKKMSENEKQYVEDHLVKGWGIDDLADNVREALKSIRKIF